MSKKILMIGAHHDDIELGCGGTAASYIAAGAEITWLVCTRAEYRNIQGYVQRTNEVAENELARSAEILGVCDTRTLDFQATTLTHSYELIVSIEKVINEINPDIIFTHWAKDVHQDHRAVALSTITAARKQSSVLCYQSNWYQSDSIFDPRMFVDISEFMDLKKTAILQHKSEFKKFGKDWLNFVVGRNQAWGQLYNCKFAESFEIVKYKLNSNTLD